MGRTRPGKVCGDGHYGLGFGLTYEDGVCTGGLELGWRNERYGRDVKGKSVETGGWGVGIVDDDA